MTGQPGPLGPPLQQEAEGGPKDPRGRWGGRKSSASAGTIRLEILRRLGAGQTSIQALTKALGLAKSTVQYHRDFLLSEGALERSTLPPGCFYSKGPAYDAAETRLGGGRKTTGGPVLPTGQAGSGRRFVLLTSGERTFQVLDAPADPSSAAGCYASKVVSKVPNFWFRHTDQEGRSWTMHFRAGRGSRSVTVHPPHVRRNQIPDSPEGWGAAARNWCSKEAHRWAVVAGFMLNRSRQAIRDSRPVEYAFPGAAPTGRTWGEPGETKTWAEDTPSARTVETTDEELAAELEVLVPTQRQARANDQALFQETREVRAQVARLHRRLDEEAQLAHDLAATAGKIASVVHGHGQALAHQLQAAAAQAAPAPSPPSSPLPRDDNRSGYA